MTGMAIDAPDRYQSQAVGADIEALVYTYYDTIHRLTLSILNDVDEADDATQETFIAAARALDQFRGQASLKTWLYTIAINQCRRQMRKRKRQQTLFNAWQTMRSLSPRPSLPEEMMTDAETEALLHTAVSELKEKHQLPVILHYTHSMTAPEIAEILGVNEGTVYSRLHYARRQLRQKLEIKD